MEGSGAEAEAEKRRLRGQAHGLKPCVFVGTAGVTAPVIAETGAALDHHELIKVRIRVADRRERDRAVADLVAATGAALISRVGNIAVLFRPATRADGKRSQADEA